MIRELNAMRRFKSYYGLNGAEKKLRKFLTDFEFVDISNADKSICWDSKHIIDKISE